MAVKRLRLESDGPSRTVVLRDNQVPATFESLRYLVCSKLSKDDPSAAFTFIGPKGGIFTDSDVADLFDADTNVTVFCRRVESSRPRPQPPRKGARKKRNSSISVDTKSSRQSADAYDTPSTLSSSDAYSDSASSFESESDSDFRSSRTATPTPGSVNSEDEDPTLRRKVSFGPTTTFTLSPTSPESPGDSPPPDSGPKYLPPDPSAVARQSALKSPSPRIVPQSGTDRPPSPKRMLTKARSTPAISPNRRPPPPPPKDNIYTQQTERPTTPTPKFPARDASQTVKVSVIPVVPPVRKSSITTPSTTSSTSSNATKVNNIRNSVGPVGAVTVRSFRLNAADHDAEVVEIKDVHLQAMRRARSLEYLRGTSSTSNYSDYANLAPLQIPQYNRQPVRTNTRTPSPTVFFVPKPQPPPVPSRQGRRTPSGSSQHGKQSSSQVAPPEPPKSGGGLVGLLRRLSNRNLRKAFQKEEPPAPVQELSPPESIISRRPSSQYSVGSSKAGPPVPPRKKPPPPPPSPAHLKEIYQPALQYLDQEWEPSPRREASFEEQVEEFWPRSGSVSGSSITMQSPVPPGDAYWASQGGFATASYSEHPLDRRLMTPPADDTPSRRPAPPPIPLGWAGPQAAAELRQNSAPLFPTRPHLPVGHTSSEFNVDSSNYAKASTSLTVPSRKSSEYTIGRSAFSPAPSTSSSIPVSSSVPTSAGSRFMSPMPPSFVIPERGSSRTIAAPPPAMSPALPKWDPGLEFRMAGREYAFPFVWKNDVHSTASDLMAALARPEFAAQRAWGYKQAEVNELSASIRYIPRDRSAKKRGKTGFGLTQFTIFFNNGPLFQAAVDLYTKKTSSLGAADFRHYFIRPLQAVAHLYVNENVVTEWACIEPPPDYRGASDGRMDYHVAYIVKDMREDLTEECRTHVELWIKANMTVGEW
ncbi:hypothetical protein HDU93_009805, partial [Gonapodya sp. JEL0774]